MCRYRNYQYPCGHPAGQRLHEGCIKYPSCRNRRVEGGTFTLRNEPCPQCLYDTASVRSGGGGRLGRR
jgi:hypothetical protein